MSPSTSPCSWNICSQQPFPSFLWISPPSVISLINTIPASTSSSLSPYVHLCPLKSVPITGLTLWGHYHFIQLTPDFFFRHPTCGACALTASNIIHRFPAWFPGSNLWSCQALSSLHILLSRFLFLSTPWWNSVNATIPLTTMSASSLALPDQLLLFSNIWFELPF